MKVKKFKNLWTMGLILFGALLVLFYIAKIFFPEFIVGVAETPSIVAFGEFVDSHWWAYYLFNGISSYFVGYIYCCACCKVKYLNKIESLLLLFLTAFSFVVAVILPNLSFVYNNILYLLAPLIIVKLKKNNDKNLFYSTTISFIVNSLAQAMSLEIREISTLIVYPNSATFLVLLIDAYIWNILLYLYFNYKGDKENG